MYTLNLKHKFSAAHELKNYIGECANLHGHTYKLQVTLKTNVLQKDMVIDFKVLKKILINTIDKKFDHKYINKIVDYNPTAENMAKDIYYMLKKKVALVSKVELWEGDNSSVIYSEEIESKLDFSNYISGFVDGEGYFCLREKGKCFEAWFGIMLRQDDKAILKQIQKYFDCGILQKENRLKKDKISRKPLVRYEIRKYKDLFEKVIPHFEKYPLQAKKKRDYAIWKEAVSIMYFGLHKKGKDKEIMKERMSKLSKALKKVRLYPE